MPGTQETFIKCLFNRGMHKGKQCAHASLKCQVLRTYTSAVRNREGLRVLKTLIFFSPGHCQAPGSESPAQLVSITVASQDGSECCLSPVDNQSRLVPVERGH